HRFPWTSELDELLRERLKESGVTEAVSQLQQRTGWPRDVIIRRAHRLGVPTCPREHRAWTAADTNYLIQSVGHASVKVMAQELGGRRPRTGEIEACRAAVS